MRNIKMYKDCEYKILNCYQHIYWASDSLADVQKVIKDMSESMKIVDKAGNEIPRNPIK